MKQIKTEIAETSIDAAWTKLSKLPKKVFTLNIAINKLAPVIIDKITNYGYTYEEICEVLKKEDIIISPSTLKTYLGKFKKSNAPTTQTQER